MNVTFFWVSEVFEIFGKLASQIFILSFLTTNYQDMLSENHLIFVHLLLVTIGIGALAPLYVGIAYQFVLIVCFDYKGCYFCLDFL